MAAEGFGLQELEAKLIEDRDGAFRDRLRSGFDAQAQALKRAIDRGVVPAEYERLSRARAAFECAGETVGELWRRLHEI